ncbi:MAG: hypothetical protein ABI823_14610 [Bryobacteraceae bacterium]
MSRLLNDWLEQATRCLSRDARLRVRTEIQEHYDLARETALDGGSTRGEADGIALNALGNPNEANRQYRQVLLTAAETRMLREGNWEARTLCSRQWLKWVLLAAPVGALAGAFTAFAAGATEGARELFAIGIVSGLLCAALFLPIYTPSRARVFRVVKWIALIGAMALAFGADAMKLSWLIFSCLWPMVWIEWTRSSIRRKLRVADWPKQLYL